MGHLKDDLRCGRELEETHISWVFLGESEVWKVKKPVDFGFLDFSTPEKRRLACEAEVEFNRRLAPEVYLGVAAVTRDAAGVHRLSDPRAAEADAEIVDWAVHMRRLPSTRRADYLLVAGQLEAADLDRLAEHLATFHAAARADEQIAAFGTPHAIGINVRENFDQTRDSIAAYLSPAEAREIEAWQKTALDERRELFEARRRAGRIRDGHGDLRLEHVYLPLGGDDDGDGDKPAPLVVDCIEFNERFRFGDTSSDIAFLAMDLAWHGRVDLAERFLAAYARASDDFDLYSLIDFYESYRAYVRGKIAALLAADKEADAASAERAEHEARRYFRLALAAERRTLVQPKIVAVGGVIASGKSTLARRVADELAAPIVDADRTRKALLGVAATQPVRVDAWSGAYSTEMSDRVYAELLRRADVVLGSGRPVVLDASYRTRRHRQAARDFAQDRGVPFLFVECATPPEICRARLAERRGGVSDGRLEIFDAFLAGWENVEELDGEDHLLATGTDVEADLARLRARLPTWPRGLTD